MIDVIQFAAEEASDQAKRLPGEVVAAVVLTFAADGAAVSAVGALPEHLHVVLSRLVDAASDIEADLAGDSRAETDGDMLNAERLTLAAIRKARVTH